jgi:hypothetical protein
MRLVEGYLHQVPVVFIESVLSDGKTGFLTFKAYIKIRINHKKELNFHMEANHL